MMEKQLRPAEQDVDLLGRTIEPGDLIAYPVTVGRSAAMRLGRVLEKLRPSRDHEPLRAVTKPDLTRWVIRVEYTDESMDWGMGHDDPEWNVAYHTKALCTGLDVPNEVKLGRDVDYNDPLWSVHFPDRHWFEERIENKYGQFHLKTYDEAMVEYVSYHERELRLAQRKLEAGPKPKIQTLLFPGKSVIINREYAATSGVDQ